MKKTYVIVCICASLLMMGNMLFATGSQEKEPVQSSTALEEKVSLYASITAIEPILESFQKDVGIVAENTRISTSKFASTVLTEFQAGKLMADVVQAPLPVLEILKSYGVVKDYVSPVGQTYPEWARNNGGIYQFGIEYVALIYNTELVNPADVPKRYEDLTLPKWKDKIVMANPGNHATTISWLVGLKENNVFGSEAKWMEFVKGLAANNPMFVASFGPTPAPIESGEKLIGISMPKYIITKAPAPLAWAQVEQPILGSPRAIAITSSAPHPNAAAAFMEYWLADEAMSLLANKVGEYVLTPGVFPPIDGIDKAKVIPIRDLSDEELVKWGAEFEKIFTL
ncbi:MAG: extracellular solute-binding protein [Spirochaetia bacterium]|nr:extracellular solute-binding protein [Spirochaetia bacterium]